MSRRRAALAAALTFLTLVGASACSPGAVDDAAPGSSDPGRVKPEVSDGPQEPWRTGGGTSRRPNIVLITTDDQTFADLRWMPMTRRLLGGDQGLRFSDFLSNHPNCCPARAQILTGQYAQNNKVLTNAPRWGGYDRFTPETALPVWLRRAGYTTGLVGKYLNLYDETKGPEPGWSRWSATVDGLYEYRGFTQYDGRDLTMPGGYHTDFVRDWSTDYIEEQAAAGKPFFLWSSYVAPHSICTPGSPEGEGCGTPPMPAERDRDRYAEARPTFLDDPAFGRPTRDGARPTLLYSEPNPDRARKTKLFRDRIRSLAAVDRAVAATVQSLRRAGELDKTVIMFTSDNGYLFGEHELVNKDVPFDEAVHVPLLIRGPGVRSGVARRPAAMIDLAPTIAELSHATPLVPVDGRSLVGTFGGADRQGDRTVLVQGGVTGRDPKNRVWAYRGVRTMRYTYARWTKNGGIELFDRLLDPDELRNVADDPAYRPVRRELRRRAKLLGECSGSVCRVRFGPVPAPRTGRDVATRR